LRYTQLVELNFRSVVSLETKKGMVWRETNGYYFFRDLYYDNRGPTRRPFRP